MPPNAGRVFLGVAFFLALLAILITGVKVYDNWKADANERNRTEKMEALTFLADVGWKSLDQYSLSKLSVNYNEGEFPLYQRGVTRDGDVIVLTFIVINKTAASLSVSAITNRPFNERDPRSWENSAYESISVEPRGNSEVALRIFWPRGESGELSVNFYLDSGAERSIGLVKSVEIDV